MNDLTIEEDYLVVSGDKVFYTLQGEGKTMGLPVVFLRLKFCNLRCTWCDTPYAVFPDNKDFKKEGEKWSVPMTATFIDETWKCRNPDVQKTLVITGGEPLLQKKAIDNLIDFLPGWKFEVETNGTQMPTEKIFKHCQINCSPKLDNSGNRKMLRYNPEVIKAMNKNDSQFKFVVSSPLDLREIQYDFVEPLGIDVDKVVLMPLGTDTATLNKHMRLVAEVAKEKGYRMLSRLQIEIWGLTRRK